MEIGLYLVDGRRPADAARGHLALNGKASVKGTSNDSIFHLECLDVTGAQFLDHAIHRGDLVHSSLGRIAVHGSPVSFMSRSSAGTSRAAAAPRRTSIGATSA